MRSAPTIRLSDDRQQGLLSHWSIEPRRLVLQHSCALTNRHHLSSASAFRKAVLKAGKEERYSTHLALEVWFRLYLPSPRWLAWFSLRCGVV